MKIIITSIDNGLIVQGEDFPYNLDCWRKYYASLTEALAALTELEHTASSENG
jgi:hypothetical protein